LFLNIFPNQLASNLLISGTGFMGKVLVEKLLRLTEVEKIYLLMRFKKGKNPKERLNDIFSNPVCFIKRNLKRKTNLTKFFSFLIISKKK
jgi:fatty acyl-CoA reductase